MKRVCFLAVGIFLLMIVLRGSEYWQNEVKYEIHVKLDDSSHTLNARQWIIFKNNSPDTLKEIYFLLMPNAYKDTTSAYARQCKRFGWSKFLNADENDRGWLRVDSIIVNGKETELIFDLGSPDLARVLLSKPLTPKDSIVFYLRWEMKFPAPFSRLQHKGQHYEATQWYPKIAVYDKYGWHPYPYLEIGEFYGEFGTYDVYITLPKNYIVAATGDLLTESEKIFLDSMAIEGSKFFSKTIKERNKLVKKWGKDKSKYNSSKENKTIHYHQENVHDFAWFADKKFIVQKGIYITSDSKRRVNLWSFCLPENHKIWENSIQYLHDALYYYSKWYMEYPYNQVSAVDGSFSGIGGMEYPNITVCSSMRNKRIQEMTIVHEVGHNWFYGILGTDERHSAWMDEGINTFSEDRYMVEKYGVNNSILDSRFPINLLTKNIDHLYYLQRGYYRMIENKWDLPSTFYTEQFPSSLAYSVCSYSKPALVFRALRYYLGEGTFNKAMRRYVCDWKYKHPDYYDIKKIFEDVSGEDLSWAFDNMIDGNRLADYKIKRVNIEENETGYQTTVAIENLGDNISPVYIEAYSKGDTIIKKWFKPTDKIFTLRFNSRVAPKQIVIDPFQYIPEYTYINNSYKPRVKIVPFFKPEKRSEFVISTLPFIWFNNMDGLFTGLYAFRGFSMPVQNNFGGEFGYSFKRKRPIWSIRYLFKKSINISSQVSSEIKINDIIGKREFSTHFDFIKYPPYGAENVKRVYSVFLENVQLYEKAAFDPLLWDVENTFLNFGMGFEKSKGSFRDRSDFKLQFKHGLSPNNFNRVSAFYYYRYRINKVVKIENYSFFGLVTGNPPIQERFYGSGNIDSEFRERTVFDRTGESAFSPNKNYYLEGGPGLIGYNNLRYGKRAITTRFEVYRNKTGIFFAFGDLVADDYNMLSNTIIDKNFSIKSSAGLIVDLYYVKLYLTLLLSHPSNGDSRFINADDFVERIFFSIRLPKISFR